MIEYDACICLFITFAIFFNQHIFKTMAEEKLVENVDRLGEYKTVQQRALTFSIDWIYILWCEIRNVIKKIATSDFMYRLCTCSNDCGKNQCTHSIIVIVSMLHYKISWKIDCKSCLAFINAIKKRTNKNLKPCRKTEAFRCMWEEES